MKKTERDLRAVVDRYGATITKAPSGHFEVRHPAGWKFQVAVSPSDHRNLLNIEAKIKRCLRGTARRAR